MVAELNIALAGVGHWHTPLYLEPLLGQPGARVVAVSDPDPATARRYGEELGCAHFRDPADLATGRRPDLVLILGRHADMAPTARHFIAQRIPLAIEKPAGLTGAEVVELAEAARKAGSFVSVPLVFRTSGFMATIRQHAAGERLLYADFKFVAGLTSRYRQAGCHWMFDRRLAGGGVLVNLGVHFLDLIVLLAQHAPEIADARLANVSGEGDVEDYAALDLDARGTPCRVETGYLYPAPGGVFDMHFSVRTQAHYFAVTGPGEVEISELDGRRRRLSATTTNMPIYPTYVANLLEEVRRGAPPIADLTDMARIMRLVDAAYALGRPAMPLERHEERLG